MKDVGRSWRFRSPDSLPKARVGLAFARIKIKFPTDVALLSLLTFPTSYFTLFLPLASLIDNSIFWEE